MLCRAARAAERDARTAGHCRRKSRAPHPRPRRASRAFSRSVDPSRTRRLLVQRDCRHDFHAERDGDVRPRPGATGAAACSYPVSDSPPRGTSRRPAVNCEFTHTVLHGYLDAELDAARAADFERHLVSCPECVAALEANENLRSSLQRANLYERAPSALREKVRKQLGASSSPSVIPMRNPAPWRCLAIAAAFLLAVFLAWPLLPLLRGNQGETALASAIVDAHLRSLQPGHLEDVHATDQHTVKPWFDGKLDFAPPVHDFVNEGFPLQGGRLDVVHGRTVAVLVSARRKHLINVFIWPTTESDSQPLTGSQLGYHWIDWRKSRMEMRAVSDVSPDDLTELQHFLMQ